MRIRRRSIVVLLLSWAVACPNLAEATDLFKENGPDEKSGTDSLFEIGRYEANLNSGALFSPFIATKGRPKIKYTLTELGLGFMLSEPKERAWWRGNFEFAGDGFGSAIFEGSGDYIAGATLWLRYNFIQSSARLVPYTQIGGGFVFTDIDRGIVGQRFNFNLDVGFGFRYLLSERWALNLEYRYQHISNANLAPKNLGINAHGPMLGISLFF